MSAPTILLVSGRSWSTVSAGVQGMVPVSWFDLVRCVLRSPLVPSERASLVGWLLSALAAIVGEERYAGFLRVPGRSHGVGVGSSVLGQAFRSERSPRSGWCLKRVLRCSGQRGGPKKSMSGCLPFRVGLPVGDRTVLLARCFLDFWTGPWMACCFPGPSPAVEAGPQGTLGL